MVHWTAAIAFLAASAGVQSYWPAPSSTPEGAMATVSHLIAALQQGDDAGFDTIARGITVMVAPDFGMPLATRKDLAAVLKDCSEFRVLDAHPFAKMPQSQIVRVSMSCLAEDKVTRRAVVSDIWADDQHAFALFPGGVAKIWPEAKN